MPKWIILLLMSLGLVACLPSAPDAEALSPWQYSHLVALDPQDNADPSRDLIALYTRILPDDLQVRLDFLDLTQQLDYDLYLALDFSIEGVDILPLEATASIRWDYLVMIPAHGSPTIMLPDLSRHPDVIPRVFRDPAQDSLVVSFNRTAFPSAVPGFRIQVFLTNAGSRFPVDTLGPARTGERPPRRVPVLLAFWDTFPAYSPAQALRRWDGAHTGPFGERHGLRNLIAAAERARIPVHLLDLKNPSSLSALDYLDVLPDIRGAVSQGIIHLPDVIPITSNAARGSHPFLPDDAAMLQAARESRSAGLDFSLPASQAIYAPLVPPGLPGTYRVIFYPQFVGPDGGSAVMLTRLARWREHLLVPLPTPGSAPQLNREGLTLEARIALIDTAFNHDLGLEGEQPSLIVLGGNLPGTAWGSPRAVFTAMDYLADHPWIQPLSLMDLFTARPALRDTPPEHPSLSQLTSHNSQGAQIPSGISASEMSDLFLKDYRQVSSIRASQLAWQAYLSLLAPNPPESDNLYALRAGYLGQANNLLAASQWSEAPASTASCQDDVDLDGLPECVLASSRFFTLIEPDGARLTLAFYNTSPNGWQWIAPSSQFLVGISDPAEWDLNRGPAADPGAIPGAFSDNPGRWTPYSVETVAGGLRFLSPDGSIRKTFTLDSSGIRVVYDQPDDRRITVQVPLALNPGARYSPHWADRFTSQASANRWVWALNSKEQIEVRTTGQLTVHTFIDSHQALTFPENPNQNFPPGHFLPFPLAVAEIISQGDLKIELIVAPH